MPRNRVAPYEERSDEVRGKYIFIKHLRLEDAKSAPFSLYFPVCQTVLGRITDSGHFAGASLGSYPATISHTTRVLRHVLANDLCYIASLINNRGAKSLLTSFRQTGCEAPVEGLYAPKYGSPVRGAQHRSAG